MLTRWLTQLEWLHVAANLLLIFPLAIMSQQGDTELSTALLLWLSCSVITGFCFWLKSWLPKMTPVYGFDWLEQTLFLAFILLLLWAFYLPKAPFNHDTTQYLWLSTQLMSFCLLGRISMLWRKRSNRNTGTASPSPEETWLIGYASQSGTAEQLARNSASQLKKAGFQVKVANLNTLAAEHLTGYHKALFVVSTYGEGEPPDNAAEFYQLAQQWQGSLQDLQFAVLALGDRSYQQFCAFGHWLFEWLTHRQASPLQYEPIEMDSTVAGSPALKSWQQLLSQLTNLQEDVFSTMDEWTIATLSSRYCINPASPGLPCFVVKLQLPDRLRWQAGDIVDIQPKNSKSAVALWLTKHNLNGCQPVQYQQRTMPLCWALSNLQLPEEAPENDVSVAAWLEHQHPLPVRTYSIASIPEEGQLMLLIRQVKTEQGALGIGSGWLTAWAAETQPIELKLRTHSNFHLPVADDDKPIILIGNGTGIAGLRALLAERVRRGHQRNWLLFGERKQQTDFFFAKDIQQWQQQGFLPETDLVFSRDGGEHRYVQDALASRISNIRNWIDNGAAIYVCGSLDGMGGSVHQMLLEGLGESVISTLQREGRYRRDLY